MSPFEAARSPAIDHHANRTLGWLISLGGILLVLASAPLIAEMLPDFASWWNAPGFGVAASVVLLGAFGRVMPYRVAHALWVGCSVVALALLAFTFAAYRGDDPDAAGPWLWHLSPIVASFMVLWLRPWRAVLAAALIGVLPAVSGLVFLGQWPYSALAYAPIYSNNLLLTVVFIGIKSTLVGLRRSELIAREEERRSARAKAESTRQRELARLIHDEVLSVLVAATAFAGRPPEQLRKESRHALRLLRGDSPDGAGPPGGTEMDTTGAAAVISETVRDHDPGCDVHIRTSPGRVDRHAVDQIRFAAEEAMRNSVRHAGADAVRTLAISIAPDEIEVRVSDDGVGFDVSGPYTGRLGIVESIVGRMRELPDGEAEIRSESQGGTEVRLRWRR